jgi:hypothetical protein
VLRSTSERKTRNSRVTWGTSTCLSEEQGAAEGSSETVFLLQIVCVNIYIIGTKSGVRGSCFKSKTEIRRESAR